MLELLQRTGPANADLAPYQERYDSPAIHTVVLTGAGGTIALPFVTQRVGLAQASDMTLDVVTLQSPGRETGLDFNVFGCKIWFN